MPLDNGDELFYHVDKHDKVLGSVPRRVAHANKTIIHRAVGIIILNHKKEMLLQQRSLKKDMDPGHWSYGVGGHVTYGQTYKEAAIRELEEEMQLANIAIEELSHLIMPMQDETEFMTIYEAIAPNNWQPQPDADEIDAIAWVPLKKLKDFLNTHKTNNWTIKTLTLTGYL